MPDTPATLRIRFTRSRDYRILTANGAWGGVSPNGTVSVDFYVEKLAPPEAIVYRVEGETTVEERVQRQEEEGKILERESQVGFLFSPAVARAIGMWLIEQAESLERIMAGLQAESEEIDAADS